MIPFPFPGTIHLVVKTTPPPNKQNFFFSSSMTKTTPLFLKEDVSGYPRSHRSPPLKPAFLLVIAPTTKPGLFLRRIALCPRFLCKLLLESLGISLVSLRWREAVFLL
eukprot:TRINITY_DN436_c0_g1_i3.p1 TRINITY_DN436_c0_g1~~TRINITY_DN436_c0_g1_i3.p1  ORF type:complete len:108 (-),score=12.71 TRINITY_DN436_c0_g1_i3:527-850(-)